MLADFMTMEEEFGHLKGLKLVFCGDARNNVGNSLMVMSAKCGVNLHVALLKIYGLMKNLLKSVKK